MSRLSRLGLPLVALCLLPCRDAAAAGLEQRLSDVVERLAAVDSRVTGYPGCDRAA